MKNNRIFKSYWLFLLLALNINSMAQGMSSDSEEDNEDKKNSFVWVNKVGPRDSNTDERNIDNPSTLVASRTLTNDFKLLWLESLSSTKKDLKEELDNKIVVYVPSTADNESTEDSANNVQLQLQIIRKFLGVDEAAQPVELFGFLQTAKHNTQLRHGALFFMSLLMMHGLVPKETMTPRETFALLEEVTNTPGVPPALVRFSNYVKIFMRYLNQIQDTEITYLDTAKLITQLTSSPDTPQQEKDILNFVWAGLVANKRITANTIDEQITIHTRAYGLLQQIDQGKTTIQCSRPIKALLKFYLTQLLESRYVITPNFQKTLLRLYSEILNFPETPTEVRSQAIIGLINTHFEQRALRTEADEKIPYKFWFDTLTEVMNNPKTLPDTKASAEIMRNNLRAGDFVRDEQLTLQAAYDSLESIRRNTTLQDLTRNLADLSQIIILKMKKVSVPQDVYDQAMQRLRDFEQRQSSFPSHFQTLINAVAKAAAPPHIIMRGLHHLVIFLDNNPVVATMVGYIIAGLLFA